jgi:hypothetical protein
VEAVFRLYARMQAAGVKPDRHNVSCMIATCSEGVRKLSDQLAAGTAAGGQVGFASVGVFCDLAVGLKRSSAASSAEVAHRAWCSGLGFVLVVPDLLCLLHHATCIRPCTEFLMYLPGRSSIVHCWDHCADSKSQIRSQLLTCRLSLSGWSLAEHAGRL